MLCMCLRIDTKVFFVELFVTQGIVFESITEFAVQLNVYIYIYITITQMQLVCWAME
jgi:hypothetical protein